MEVPALYCNVMQPCEQGVRNAYSWSSIIVTSIMLMLSRCWWSYLPTSSHIPCGGPTCQQVLIFPVVVVLPANKFSYSLWWSYLPTSSHIPCGGPTCQQSSHIPSGGPTCQQVLIFIVVVLPANKFSYSLWWSYLKTSSHIPSGGPTYQQVLIFLVVVLPANKFSYS